MKTPESSLMELAFRAESGDAAAQLQLGMLFLMGEGVDQDLEAAHRWMARAAEAKQPGTQILADHLAQVGAEQFSKQIGLNGFERTASRRIAFASAWRAVTRLAGLIRRAMHRTAFAPKDVGRVATAGKAASLVDAA